MAKDFERSSRIPTCDAYFAAIQSRKRLPTSLQESLTAAFSQIPVSSFPEVPGGKVIEVSCDASIIDTVRILSRNNILAAPLRSAKVGSSTDWRARYIGIIDYFAVVLWVLENAELAAFALSAGSATTAALGIGAVGGVAALAVGATGPAAITGITVAAAGAALASGIAAEKSIRRDAATAADHFGEHFYRLLLQEEPFKSTTVKSVVEMYGCAPFLPVAVNGFMLTVLLLLSKYKLRNIPVIDEEKLDFKNFITQSAVVRCLEQCKGRDWFDCIAARPLSDLGLPFMSYDEVISIRSDELILAAFKRMKENKIGGLPVVENSNRKIVGCVCIQDIRFLLLRPELFSGFRELTVMDFIKAIESASADSGTQLLSCKPDASLGSVIESLASRNKHRIYVLNGDEVAGVITLRDVISCFIYEPPEYFEEYFRLAIKDI